MRPSKEMQRPKQRDVMELLIFLFLAFYWYLERLNFFGQTLLKVNPLNDFSKRSKLRSNTTQTRFRLYCPVQLVSFLFLSFLVVSTLQWTCSRTNANKSCMAFEYSECVYFGGIWRLICAFNKMSFNSCSFFGGCQWNGFFRSIADHKWFSCSRNNSGER